MTSRRWGVLGALLIVLTGLSLPIGEPTTSLTPWFGVLEAKPSQQAALRQLGVDTITVGLGWNTYKPTPDSTNGDYLNTVRARVTTLRHEGYRVILDLGLQYPPEWAFTLTGAARLRDQFGDVPAGGSGSSTLNAVFSPAVQQAEGEYIRQVARDLGPVSVDAVRIGGLHMGELSYPPSAPGHRSLWMYDSTAQARSPVPGWRPGPGQGSQAAAALTFYYDSLNSYERFLLDTVAGSFPVAGLHLLLPSWGLRPGQSAAAVRDGLQGSSPGELNDAVTQALDWPTQLDLLARYGRRGVAYTTWLDAPSQGSSSQLVSPAEYLASLARTRGLLTAGENTGGTNLADMNRSLERVRSLGLIGMQWMTAADLLRAPALAQAYQVATARRRD